MLKHKKSYFLIMLLTISSNLSNFLPIEFFPLLARFCASLSLITSFLVHQNTKEQWCRVTYCDLSHAGCWLTIQDTSQLGLYFFDIFIKYKYLPLFSARRFTLSDIIQKYPTHLRFINAFTSTFFMRLTRSTMRTQPTLTTISIPPSSHSLLTSIYTIRTRIHILLPQVPLRKWNMFTDIFVPILCMVHNLTTIYHTIPSHVRDVLMWDWVLPLQEKIYVPSRFHACYYMITMFYLDIYF